MSLNAAASLATNGAKGHWLEWSRALNINKRQAGSPADLSNSALWLFFKKTEINFALLIPPFPLHHGASRCLRRHFAAGARLEPRMPALPQRG